MATSREKNKPAVMNGNSLALDQALARELAKKALKAIKKRKTKCDYWLEDLNLKARYEFSQREQFERTIKKLTTDDQNKRLRASHPRLLNAVRRKQSITEKVA